MPRIVHLSDLHFRPSDPEDRDRAARALLATLAREAEQGRPVDLILVSGDLVERGDPVAYGKVARFFDLLLEACGGLDKSRLLVVPGNHDVDRAAGRRLQRTLADAADAESFFSDVRERALHLRKLGSYQSFVVDYFGAPLPANVVVEVCGVRIGVALLSTCWFSQGDDDRGLLWLGHSLLAADAQAVADAELRVALLHHPPEWLHPVERAQVMGLLAGRFDLVCHGHLHSRRAPDYEGTPLAGRAVLAAGAVHHGPDRQNRIFLIDVDAPPRGARIQPLHFVRGAPSWEPEEEARALALPRARAAAHETPQRAAEVSPSLDGPARAPRAAHDLGGDDEALRLYLTRLVEQADAHRSAFLHPRDETPLLSRSLYIDLPARVDTLPADRAVSRRAAPGETLTVPVLLSRHRLVLLWGERGQGKTTSLIHLAGQLARHALGMPSEADTFGFAPEELPLPLLLPSRPAEPSSRERSRVARPLSTLPARFDAGLRSISAQAPPGLCERLLGRASVLLLVDDLDALEEAGREPFLRELLALTEGYPKARLLVTARRATLLGLLPLLRRLGEGEGAKGLTLAALAPLSLPERTALVDRFMQLAHHTPVGMTLGGQAAELLSDLRDLLASGRAQALSEHPLFLHALCWLSMHKGLPRQRAEIYAECMGVLILNRIRPSAEEVAELIDELAQHNEELSSFRVAQALSERADPWSAVALQLDEPATYDTLRFLAGLLARKGGEAGARLLRSLLSEAGARKEAGARAQLFALAAQMLVEMSPYLPDQKLIRRIQDELTRMLDQLSDRMQRTPLPTRIAIAEGLGRAGDPRIPVDLLTRGGPGREAADQLLPRGHEGPWVELRAGRGRAILSMLRYPVTCAQFYHFVVTAGYVPPVEPGARQGTREVLAFWAERAETHPNHPVTMVSWEDALALCRFLSQQDWSYIYDLPTESEWESAVRQGHTDNRFYPWGGSMETAYCNTGRRVGHTTPVGVFPAGTANGGRGCADLIGNVWQLCQNEHDDDPTLIDVDESGELDLSALAQRGEKVARGGSFAYLRSGAMRQSLPGTRSDDVGIRLVRRAR